MEILFVDHAENKKLSDWKTSVLRMWLVGCFGIFKDLRRWFPWKKCLIKIYPASLRTKLIWGGV